MPTRRLPSWRRAAWWPVPRARSCRSRRGRRVSRAGRRTPTGARRRRAGRCGRSGPARSSSAGGAGDRGGAGVVLAGFGVGVAVRVVAELAEDPGAEHRPEAGLAAGRSQRPGAGQNTCAHHLLQGGDLGVQGADQLDLGGDDRGVGGGHGRRLASCSARSTAWIAAALAVDVAAPGPAQRRGDLCARQPRRPVRVGRRSSSSSASPAARGRRRRAARRGRTPAAPDAAAEPAGCRSQISV